MSKKVNVLEGNEAKLIVRLSLPMFLGLMAVILFNVVDTAWVGQLGKAELAAMSFTFPVTFVISNLAIGIGIGASSAISRAIGNGDNQRVRKLTTHSLLLANALVFVLAGLGLLTIDPLFQALGADAKLLPLVRAYMVPYYLGVGFLVIPMISNSVLRATGNVLSPSIMMAAAGLGNALLDPLLIFGIGPFPKLGLQGAAIATVFSYLVAFCMGLWMLIGREKLIDFSFPKASELAESWKEVLKVGVPAAATNMLVPVASGFLTRMVAGHGRDAVAAYGIGTRIESLCLIGVFALSASITPFVGQNYGAKKYDRLGRGMRAAMAMAFGWEALVALGLFGLCPLAVGLFAKSAAVKSIAIFYLRVLPLSYGMLGMGFVVNSYFNALGRPIFASSLIITRLFLLSLPMAWVGSWLGGLKGLFIGYGMANITTGFLSVAVAWKVGALSSDCPQAGQPLATPSESPS